MSRFLVSAFLKPILAIAFFLGFGGFFVFGGFQSAAVDLHRGLGRGVTGKLTRSHFFGLYSVSTELAEVKGATIETREAHPRAGHASPLSGLALVSESGSTPIFWGFSNVDEQSKLQITRTVNHYIRSGDNHSFHETFVVRNLFGWFGLPFFLIGIYAALSWPVTIVSSWRRHIAAAAVLLLVGCATVAHAQPPPSAAETSAYTGLFAAAARGDADAIKALVR